MKRSKVKINNYEYKVCIVGPNNDKLMMPDGKYHCGVTHYIENEIYIANNLPSETFINVLIHELTHAYIDSYGMSQVEWTEEIVADFVGTYLRNILETLGEIQKQLEREERKRWKKRSGKE